MEEHHLTTNAALEYLKVKVELIKTKSEVLPPHDSKWYIEVKDSLEAIVRILDELVSIHKDQIED